MASIPDDVQSYLPSDFEKTRVAAFALVERSFDRTTGEVLVLRQKSGAIHVLTRPGRFDGYRELPLSETPPRILWKHNEFQLQVTAVDGRVLCLMVLDGELPLLRGVIETQIAVPSSIPPSMVESGDTRHRSDAPREAPKYRSTLRPPKAGHTDVVSSAPTSSRRPASVDERSSAKPTQVDARNDENVALSTRTAPVRVSERPNAQASEPAPAQAGRSVRPPLFSSEIPVVRPSAAPSSGNAEVDHLRDAFESFCASGSIDAAIASAKVLTLVGKATARESRFANLLADMPPRSTNGISAVEMKRQICHPHEDNAVQSLAALLCHGLMAMRLTNARDLGLRPADEVNLSDPPEGFPRLYVHVASMLSLAPPSLYIRSDVAGGLAYLVTHPAGSLCGRTLATTFDPQSSMYVTAHHLSFYREGAYLFALCPTPTELFSLCAAALVADNRIAADAATDELARKLRGALSATGAQELRAALSYLPLGNDPLTVVYEHMLQYRRGVHHTAARMAFFVSGSLAVAMRVHPMMPAAAGIETRDILADLAEFSTSHAWLDLRAQLGICYRGPMPTE